VRNHLDKARADDRQDPTADREFIEQNVERIIVKSQAIEIYLVSEAGRGLEERGHKITARRPSQSDSPVAITVPRTTTVTVATKGVLHSPSPSPVMSTDNRDVLLTAIAKARAWVDDLVQGRATSFAEIAGTYLKIA
jgi:site-specific DNA recombinase